MNFIARQKFESLGGGKLRNGDQLYCLRGSLGKHAVFDHDTDAAIASSLVILRPVLDACVPYLSIYLDTDIAETLLRRFNNGSAQPNLSSANLRRYEIPLPPLAEQHRIVAKVDELMALCDRLEAAQNKREQRRDRLAAASLNRISQPAPSAEGEAALREHARFHITHFPRLTTRPEHIKALRQTILSLAVRGRLVPQDTNNEPAIQLLKWIADERADLVKHGLVRREKPLDSIQSTDLPFPVPQMWNWARIGDAVLFTQYGTSQKSHPSDEGIPVLTMGNIQDGLVVWNNEKRISEASEDLSSLLLLKFDLLYNRTNSAELVGKTGIYLGEDNIRTFASYLIRLRPSLTWTDPRFLNMAMNTTEFRETQIVPLIKKQTGQANVNGTALKNMLIPLPPFAEQHRIVAKVDELMAVCDQLETHLTSTQTDSRRLLEAVLRDALTPALEAAA